MIDLISGLILHKYLVISVLLGEHAGAFAHLSHDAAGSLHSSTNTHPLYTCAESIGPPATKN